MTNNQNRIYVIMGVSGSGKSAVAAAAARQLSAGFLDGDFLHPRSNILKMAAGEPLNDDDRAHGWPPSTMLPLRCNAPILFRSLSVRR